MSQAFPPVLRDAQAAFDAWAEGAKPAKALEAFKVFIAGWIAASDGDPPEPVGWRVLYRSREDGRVLARSFVETEPEDEQPNRPFVREVMPLYADVWRRAKRRAG